MESPPIFRRRLRMTPLCGRYSALISLAHKCEATMALSGIEVESKPFILTTMHCTLTFDKKGIASARLRLSDSVVCGDV
jgi:2'-5' RNA ligase